MGNEHFVGKPHSVRLHSNLIQIIGSVPNLHI